MTYLRIKVRRWTHGQSSGLVTIVPSSYDPMREAIRNSEKQTISNTRLSRFKSNLVWWDGVENEVDWSTIADRTCQYEDVAETFGYYMTMVLDNGTGIRHQLYRYEIENRSVDSFHYLTGDIERWDSISIAIRSFERKQIEVDELTIETAQDQHLRPNSYCQWSVCVVSGRFVSMAHLQQSENMISKSPVWCDGYVQLNDLAMRWSWDEDEWRPIFNISSECRTSWKRWEQKSWNVESDVCEKLMVR